MKTDRTNPPIAKRRPERREVHGVLLMDDYGWLRDPGYPDVKDPEILAHLEAENRHYEAFFAPHRPLVARLFEEMKARIREDEESVPVRDGVYLYRWRFDKEGEYRRWYRRRPQEKDWTLVLDEPALAHGSDYFRLGAFSVSSDDRYLAWSADRDGSERFTIHVRDLETGEDLPLRIEDSIGEPVWAADSRTLIYRVLNENWRPFAIRAHNLDDADGEDRTLYEEADGGYFVHLDKSQSREWLFFSSANHDTSEVHVVPAFDPFARPRCVAPRRAGHEYELDHAEGRFFIRSNRDRADFEILTAPEDDPSPQNWSLLLGGEDGIYYRGFQSFRRFLAVAERHQGLERIRIRDHASGETHVVALPETVASVGFGSNPEYDVEALRLVYQSMITPPTVFDYHIAQRRLETLKVQEIPSGYDRTLYETARLMAPAEDGALVPVSLVWKKGRELAPGPLHLYGYGAYGMGMSPSFSTARLSLLDRGFVYAIAHVRGGDEMGRDWYEGGRRQARSNCFTDFIAAAEHLIKEGWTSRGDISISGGSAGGKLVGAVLNMRPDLWRAAVAHVPFVDVLNTMLDASLPLTPLEWPEWGNPAADPEAFRTILGYSPYENVKAQDYPPIMITCGLNDPRVTYWEPVKWAARLRALKTDDNPLILKINMGGGHSGKSGRFEALHETAEEYAFLLLAFGREGLIE
ncbi:MAG: S9 family peptidase [Rhodothalassiaceae bacterium]